MKLGEGGPADENQLLAEQRVAGDRDRRLRKQEVLLDLADGRPGVGDRPGR